MKIFTYYAKIENCHEQQWPIVELFESIWNAKGHEVIVLTPEDTASHPLFELVSKAAENFPTLNHRGFERHCFIRWCAMALAAKNTEQYAFADYDVFPNWNWQGFPPQPHGFVNLDIHGGPGMVVGWKRSFENVIDTFLRFDPGARNHVSDMVVMQHLKHLLFDDRLNWMRCYGTQGWEDKPLIHFGNEYLKKDRPKVDQIKEILARMAEYAK